MVFLYHFVPSFPALIPPYSPLPALFILSQSSDTTPHVFSHLSPGLPLSRSFDVFLLFPLVYLRPSLPSDLSLLTPPLFLLGCFASPPLSTSNHPQLTMQARPSQVTDFTKVSACDWSKYWHERHTNTIAPCTSQINGTQLNMANMQLYVQSSGLPKALYSLADLFNGMFNLGSTRNI